MTFAKNLELQHEIASPVTQAAEVRSSSALSKGSTSTDGRVRIEATAFFVGITSHDKHRFEFGYRIRVTNLTAQRLQLIARRWLVIDADGRTHQVTGRGVNGVEPILAPNRSSCGSVGLGGGGAGAHADVYEYTSMCPLKTHWGTMEGAYSFRILGGVSSLDGVGSAMDDSSADSSRGEFTATIRQFLLVASEVRSPEAAIDQRAAV